MLKTEKESSAINDFFVFFNNFFKLDKSKKTDEQADEMAHQSSETEKINIPDSIQSEIK